MAFKGTILSKSFTNGQVRVNVQFDDDSAILPTFIEVLQNTTTPRNWPDAQIRIREDQLNSVDLSQIQLGVRKDAEPDPGKTQEQLDLAAFLDLLVQYRFTQGQIKAGVDKVTQADLDALLVQIKATFKDEYAPFMVGLF